MNIVKAIKSTNGKFFRIEYIGLGSGKKFSKTVRTIKTVKLINHKAIQVFDTASKKIILIMISSIRRIITKKESYFDWYLIRNFKNIMKSVTIVSIPETPENVLTLA